MIKELVVKAYIFSQEKHKGQMRKYSDLEYFSHPKAVARILEDMHQDEFMVAAALLHDVVEDTGTTLEEIEELFGDAVASLVDEVTEKTEERNTLNKDEYLIWKVSRMSERGLILKLADRLHNVLFLDRDATCKEHFGFAKYYMKHTRVVLNSLKYTELTEIQKALYDRIHGIIRYLEIKYFEK
jgi:(p)ppGpp synthase/HD superfamily hydrolase